jgi:hypothetical protein
MKAAQSSRATPKKREAVHIAQTIASALAQRKNKSEIVEELTRCGLSEASAWEWVNRAIP